MKTKNQTKTNTAKRKPGRPRKNQQTPLAAQGANQYQATQNALKQQRFVAAQNEIGPLPPIADIQRREKARNDLEYFLKTYFPNIFYRPFSEAHLQFIKDAEEITIRGGRVGLALPRACGKTSLCICACTWAVLYHKSFVVLVAATAAMGKRLCADLKTHLQAPLLMADFPELICFERLKGIAQRAKTQTSNGVLTHVGIDANSLTFPTFPGVETSGRTVVCAGLTGSIRGLHRVTDSTSSTANNSTVLRPDLIFLDDISKKGSIAETASRERLVNSDILNLAGHDKEVSALFAGTVIQADDLTSRIIANPAWRGRKYRIIDSFGDEAIWKDFDEVWKREASGEAQPGSAANEYRKIQPLLANLKPLDPNLFGVGEVDAIHHCRVKYLSVGEAAFSTEYLNEPFSLAGQGVDYSLSVSDILKKGNGLKRYQIPEDAVKVCAGLDVNKYAVSFCVAAFTPTGTCSVVDYGWHTPKKNQPIYTNSDNAEEKIISAVGEVIDNLYCAPYGEAIDLLSVDSGFMAQAIYNAVDAARKRHGGKRIYPSKGWSAERYEQPRNRKLILSRGEEADLRKVFPSGHILHFNSTYWNIKTQKAFLFAPGTDGEITLYGEGKKHRPFAEQIANQELTRLQTNKFGKQAATWELHGKNEMLDCLSLCEMLNTVQMITLRGKGKWKPSERGATGKGTETHPEAANAPKTQNNATGEAIGKDGNADDDKPLTLAQLWKRKKSKGNWATSWQ